MAKDALFLRIGFGPRGRGDGEPHGEEPSLLVPDPTESCPRPWPPRRGHCAWTGIPVTTQGSR